MANLTRGTFTLNLGVVRLSGELKDEDRQCAWELYAELSTRVAVTGKRNDTECKNFDGELLIESISSLYNFFQEARNIMRKFPVGKIVGNNKKHLGIMISNMMDDVLRPFLERWQVEYRHWWENESNPRMSPIARQREFPGLDVFISDWSSVRWLMREVQNELVKVYDLVSVGTR